jgi:hypothetical protein
MWIACSVRDKVFAVLEDIQKSVPRSLGEEKRPTHHRLKDSKVKVTLDRLVYDNFGVRKYRRVGTLRNMNGNELSESLKEVDAIGIQVAVHGADKRGPKLLLV